MLYFSSSDGTDPARNGRRYTVLYGKHESPRRRALIAALAIEMDELHPEERELKGITETPWEPKTPTV